MRLWLVVRRIVPALALVAFPLVLALSEFNVPPGDTMSGKGLLGVAGANEAALRTASLLWTLGVLVAAPALLAAMRMTRPRAPILADIGGGLMLVGYLVSVGLNGVTEVGIGAAATGGQSSGAVAAALEWALQTSVTITIIFLVLAAGSVIGTALLGLAMGRSHTVPWWAAATVIAWPAFHIGGLVLGNNRFEVVGFALQVIGFGFLGLRMLRSASEPDTRRTAPTHLEAQVLAPR